MEKLSLKTCLKLNPFFLFEFVEVVAGPSVSCCKWTTLDLNLVSMMKIFIIDTFVRFSVRLSRSTESPSESEEKMCDVI